MKIMLRYEKLIALFFLSQLSFQLVAYQNYLDTSFGIDGVLKKSIGKVSIAGKLTTNGCANIALSNSSFGRFFIRHESNTLEDPLFLNDFKHSSIEKIVDANFCLLQDDGKVIVIGCCTINAVNHLFIARYTTSNILDITFGDKGYLFFSHGSGAYPLEVFRENDSIVILGKTSVEQVAKFFIIQLNEGGLLTSSISDIPVKAGDERVYIAHAVRDFDNRCVVIGNLYRAASCLLYISRFTMNGLLDTSFGAGGDIALSFVESPNWLLKNSAVQPVTNHIIVLLSINNIPALMRFTSAGERDYSFGGAPAGIVYLPKDFFIESLHASAEGKILLAGYKSGQVYITQYTPDGLLDTLFYDKGFINPLLGVTSAAIDVWFESDGRLLVSGMVDSQMALMKFRHPSQDIISISDFIYDEPAGTLITITGNSTNVLSAIKIYIDDREYALEKSNAQGNWHCEIETKQLINGMHVLKAEQQGGCMQEVEYYFEVKNDVMISIKNALYLPKTLFIFGNSNLANARFIVSINGEFKDEGHTSSDGDWSMHIKDIFSSRNLISVQLLADDGTVASTALLFAPTF